MKPCRVLGFVIMSIVLGACAAPDIVVDKAWIRTPPPGKDMTAAYLEIKNNTSETITLVHADSDAFASVTMHESRVVDGVWEMTVLPSLAIAAGQRVSFQPGGKHLMMTAPRMPIETGGWSSIRLQFDNGTLVTVVAVVHDSAP